MNAWPEKDLEEVPSCPVCGAREKTLLFSGLTDRVFGVAVGKWALWQCDGCGSAYLNPRPTRQSIGRAYDSYYTHTAEDHRFIRRHGSIRTLLQDLVNGYQNQRYGVGWEHARATGRWLIPLVPSLRAAADAECRHLPPLPPKGGTLLDIGCGNGGFLVLASRCGWHVEGLDLDEAAVTTARSRGLTVHQGGVESLEGREAQFDVVTISHVIEHVYDPEDLLRRVFGLLRPGGTLWLETPNICSLGAARFGSDWRDLDPPRHLVLFNEASLERMLRGVGFAQTHQLWHGMSVFETFAASEAIAAQRPGNGASYAGRPPWHALIAEVRCMVQPGRREFLTIRACK